MIKEAEVLNSLPSVKISLRFQGGRFDPDEITERLGIEPTTTFRPGDPITEDGEGRRRRDGWRLAVKERETLEIGPILEELRGHVAVPGSVVRKLCADLGVGAVVVCSVLQRGHETAPALVFPADFIGWISDLGASLELDVWT